jgi:uncharacterized protein
MLCHVAAFAGLFFPMGHILGPLIVWLIRKDQFPLVDDQGKQALNFQLSVSLYSLAFIAVIVALFVDAALVTLTLDDGQPPTAIWLRVGAAFLAAFGLLALAAFNIIAVVVAAVRASAGERFRYPLNIGIIR